MELIWRLETLGECRGPYHARIPWGGTKGDYYGDNHPGPRTDGVGEVCGHVFGFTSLADARRWWYQVDDLRHWHTHGLRLAVWPQTSSPDIRKGNNQCAFVRPGEAPLYLPAFALHEVSEDLIVAMAADHFNQGVSA